MKVALHKQPGNREGKSGKLRSSVRNIAVGAELEELKRCLLIEHLDVVADAQTHPWLSRAADEAASIAWATPHPLLVLPVLLDEKLNDARRKAELQKAIYARSQSVVALTE